MDVDQKEIRDFVFGYVNQLVTHRIDEDALRPELDEILDKCEELALDIDKGKYELPLPEREEMI